MTPKLTDIDALERSQRRTAQNPAMFLHETAASEIKDRLSFVKKSFTDKLVLSRQPLFWEQFSPGSRHVAPTETLPLDENAFDLAIHAMSLHWANDPVGQLIQIRRALRPDGLFLGVFFGGRTLHELRSALAQAETEIAGGLSPRIVPMGDIRELGALLQRAGFALPVADIVPLTVSYETVFHLMRDLRAMGETNALAGRIRRFTRKSVFDRAAEIYHSAYQDEGGRVLATFELVILTGWSPAPGQQQPLRPGSAVNRLADVLGTNEFSLKD